MKRFLKRIKKDKKIIIIALISLLVLVLGSIFIGFIPSILIVAFLDVIIFLMTKTKRKKNGKEVFKTFLIVGFTCAIFMLIMAVSFATYIVLKAPEFNPDKLANKDASVLYYRNGEELTKLGDELRETVTYDQLSQSLIDAVIATEDARYFQHSGVDLPRFIKASLNQLLGKGGGGASTITMQVSKQTQTSTKDEGIEGIIRKFTDIYISVFEIERRYTKEQILEFYLNYNNMGGQIKGVQQASLTFFGKAASELNVSEAALLAGLFQSPNGYSPYKKPEECENRRKEVLYLMLRHGYITQEEYDINIELTVDKLIIENKNEGSKYQDFIDTVVDEVIARTNKDPYEVPMKIYTTMDKDIQDNMNNVMTGANFKWPDENIQAGSVILDVNNGEIMAVGGGHNRKKGDWNYATQNKRQIGSTAKPLFDYGPGIEYNNWSTYTGFTDEPYAYSDGKKIQNWDRKYFGFTTLHDALKYSRNIPAIKAFQQLDSKKVETFVKNLGLSPEQYLHEAHSIGGYTGESPLSVAAAYAAFSNGGYYIEPHSFTSITYDNGEEYNVKPIKRKVMSEETAYMITKVLEDTTGYAVGLSVNGVNYCSKTGTTDLDSAFVRKQGLNGSIGDKWIASYNEKYAMSVWLGYKENTKDVYKVNSFNSIKTLFQAIAKGAYKEKSSWDKPDNVIQIEVEEGFPDAKLVSEFTPSNLRVKAYFKKGFEPTETSERFSQLNNVTSLNYNENTGTLSWDAIATPKFIDKNYLTEMFNGMYTNADSKVSALNERLDYNNKYVGTVSYNIYTKNSDGSLTLIDNTTSTSYKHTITTPTTFVVKTTYSIFKSNISSGAEFNVTNVANVITSELKGDSVVNLLIGDNYVEQSPPVIILENGLNDITNKSTIIYTVKRHSDNKLFSNLSGIDTSVEDSYTITYNIAYNDYKNTLTRVIHVKGSI